MTDPTAHAGPVPHTHITRDIKQTPGECPACDAIRKAWADAAERETGERA